ncbi:hypothetical protein AMATHDRAFT_74056 [Amanita thiersii Skay4041]|uniref:SnoaL-like domain-containing protein n=1 Tax=Amanita thiersii Skay4041 TaxID=703135 RepID=A0A2A9NXQ0_9AGAR|nr:hypothetical protein AMATHDRAFT_74056 [Amanita thiersii Skay4041]
MPPTIYDPTSPGEQPVPLPSASKVSLTSNIVIQPPLTRRGTGPGLLLFLPADSRLKLDSSRKGLDPDPVQKWAEEGFAVAGLTITESGPIFPGLVKQSLEAMLELSQLDTRDKFGAIVYDPENTASIVAAASQDRRIACLIAYGHLLESPQELPILLHLYAGMRNSLSSSPVTSHVYNSPSPYFVLPYSTDYDPGFAALAHSRNLVFLRKHIGGPVFDLEAIWDEHTFFEFQERSVAKTMGTMVEEPYVNHVPTMTGGIGRAQLTAFYRDHFIFSNPEDTELQTVSRTIGSDRVVDEFVFNLTHTCEIDWLLPGIPPSGKKLAIPMIAVVNIRGDRLYHEHIWWDQATALRQAGVLPTYLSYTFQEKNQLVRLPVGGVETAEKLIDETNGESNAMFSDQWRS